MTLGIMQPYFFPYLGYFSLIREVDQFILFDTPQYIRHGWVDRNRTLKNENDFLYIQPAKIKHSNRAPIDKIHLNNDIEWQEKILAQLNFYKNKAPHYDFVIKFLSEIFEQKCSTLVEFNQYSLQQICDYLGITTPINSWSKMNVVIDTCEAPDEWALNICKALNAKRYVNSVGGMSFFDTSKYKAADIDINFIEQKPVVYQQLGSNFMPYLSIIDTMMFCDKKQIIKMLDAVNLIKDD